MRRIAIILLFTILGIKTYSQSAQLPKKTIVQIWNEILACDSTDYFLNNVEIIYEDKYYIELNKIFDSHPVIKPNVIIGAMATTTNIKVSYLVKGREGSQPAFFLTM